MTEHYSHVGAKEKMAAVDQMVDMVHASDRSPSRSPDSGNSGSPPPDPSS